MLYNILDIRYRVRIVAAVLLCQGLCAIFEKYYPLTIIKGKHGACLFYC